MLCGENPPLLAGLVRFLMECDEAVAMRGDDYLNPLYAHSPVSALVARVVSPPLLCVRFFWGASSVHCAGCLQVEARETMVPEIIARVPSSFPLL